MRKLNERIKLINHMQSKVRSETIDRRSSHLVFGIGIEFLQRNCSKGWIDTSKQSAKGRSVRSSDSLRRSLFLPLTSSPLVKSLFNLGLNVRFSDDLNGRMFRPSKSSGQNSPINVLILRMFGNFQRSSFSAFDGIAPRQQMISAWIGADRNKLSL
jgi:hypothetical protein